MILPAQSSRSLLPDEQSRPVVLVAPGAIGVGVISCEEVLFRNSVRSDP
jgi:hypothetical protein